MWDLVLKDFQEIFVDYGIFGVCIGVAAVACYLLLRYIRRKTYHLPFHFHLDRTVLVFVIALYGFLVLEVTFFSREPGTRTTTDLIPFSTFHNNARAMSYVVENILMAVPLGLLAPMAKRRLRSLWGCLALGFACSLTIETFQYILERGLFQTDDILTNVLGTLIGYGIFRLILTVRKK